jgi:hypothetical protein
MQELVVDMVRPLWTKIRATLDETQTAGATNTTTTAPRNFGGPDLQKAGSQTTGTAGAAGTPPTTSTVVTGSAVSPMTSEPLRPTATTSATSTTSTPPPAATTPLTTAPTTTAAGSPERFVHKSALLPRAANAAVGGGPVPPKSLVEFERVWRNVEGSVDKAEAYLKVHSVLFVLFLFVCLFVCLFVFVK